MPDLGWRGMAVHPQQVPPGADQVRLRAVDAATDPDGWLAVTGPRIREVISLTDYLQSSSAGRGPVLIDFQMAFLLPCQREIPRVAGGLAQAPVAVIEPSRRYPPGELPTSTIAGGNFVALNTEAQRRELPTRLRGSPDVEWGHLVLLDYPLARDAYAVEQRQSTVPGWAGS
ncbi:MAG: arabinosyltransferase C-terminal domain-containing protein [Pseudonocardiales bacterium]|nr:arabinosyltransferase C-terminal domain-containing protein [Pseudonocardiales bacterium]